MFNTSLNNGGSEKVGTIKAFGGSVAPFGWLICDGSAISRTLYAALFDVIGETYGAGDGTTTFNIPNLIGLTSDNVPCCGNNMTLGLTDGADTGGVGYTTSSYARMQINKSNYGQSVGTTMVSSALTNDKTVGITTDATKSGIISSLSSASQKSLAIIKY